MSVGSRRTATSLLPTPAVLPHLQRFPGTPPVGPEGYAKFAQGAGDVATGLGVGSKVGAVRRGPPLAAASSTDGALFTQPHSCHLSLPVPTTDRRVRPLGRAPGVLQRGRRLWAGRGHHARRRRRLCRAGEVASLAGSLPCCRSLPCRCWQRRTCAQWHAWQLQARLSILLPMPTHRRPPARRAAPTS